MLDLGMAEPGDRLLVVVSNVERVPESDDRIELVRERLEARLVADLRGTIPWLLKRAVDDGRVEEGLELRTDHHRAGGPHGRRAGGQRRAETEGRLSLEIN